MSKLQTLIMQWNVRGIRQNNGDLQILIKRYSPIVILLQETLTANDSFPLNSLKDYNWVVKEGYPNSNRDGIAIGIRKNTNYKEKPINSDLQILCIEIDYPIHVNIVNVYLPPRLHNHRGLIQDLEQILVNQRSPLIVAGDMNAHDPLWGSSKSTRRGSAIIELSNNLNLAILNNSDHTRIDHKSGQTTAIDL